MKIANMHDVADLVRRTRKEQGATQVQLAQMANVGTRFLRDVEDGQGVRSFWQIDAYPADSWD